MKNTVPKSIPALLTLAGDAADGAGLYQTPLPLLQNTQASINADITPLVSANTAYATGKAELATSRETARTLLDTSRMFLTLGRDNFKPFFGSEYNQGWDAVGLVGTLMIPRAEEDVLPLLTTYKEFLTANPSFEVVAKDITAARADELYTQLKAARSTVHAKETLVGNLLEDRDLKADRLRKRLSDLIAELHMRLDGLDARWKAFGLNVPDAMETPDQVEHVVATLIGPTAVSVKWDATARAEYYHVFKKVRGIDTEYVLVGSPADLDFTIENLPTNAVIEIVVSALNNGGEGALSEPVEITTH